MKTTCVLLILLFSIVHLSVAQDAPPPEYLQLQDFPDSVKSLPLLKQNGEWTDLVSLLERYKGKKVLIDFWASWCRDCIIGLPKLEELKQKTGEDDVAYVFISVDDLDFKWRLAIKRFDIRGDHYRTETGWRNPLTNYIVLDWVPRYIVLNENGRIIVPKAITADNPDVEKMLLKK